MNDLKNVIDYEDQINTLESKLEAKNAELRDVATMGTVITSIHEIDAVLSVVMETAIQLVDGEVGVIMLEENEQLTNKISWGINLEFVSTLKYHDNLDIATYTFTNEESIILSELGLENDDGMKIESIISIPIKSSSKCFGVILIINKGDGSSFTESNRETLKMLMSFVAVAIDNSQLLKNKLKQQKIEQEMNIAHQIQITVLPQDIASIEGVDIGAVYFPAREVGGDFYDVIKVNDKKFFVILGDVSDKGVPAALIMTAAAGIIKSTLTANPDISIAELANTTNDILAGGIIKDRQMFITLFYCMYDLEEKILTYCNAGHIPGLFWDDSEQEISELGEGGTIVGQFPGIKYKEGKQAFDSGDRLFLFTDGLTEATDDKDQLFGRERVEQVYTTEIGLSPQDFCYKVKEWVDRFTVGCSEDSVDDFTILQIKAK